MKKDPRTIKLLGSWDVRRFGGHLSQSSTELLADGDLGFDAKRTHKACAAALQGGLARE
jgi:hypothetical protein